MAKQSLLEKAKKAGKKNKAQYITAEHIELALAWTRDEVSYNQIKNALGLKVPSTVYYSLAMALKKYVQSNNS